MLKSWFFWIVVLIVAVGGYFIYKEATKPRGPATAPGETIVDLGRGHVSDISNVKYNSNPPTSGDHFTIWAKSGIYDQLISDGYLIHSLEHGYVVISYDCTKSISNVEFLISNVYAHEGEVLPTPQASSSAKIAPLMKMVTPANNASWITPQTEPADEVPLPESFKSDSCRSLVQKLTDFSKNYTRMVIVPRPNMDHQIAFTAWNHLLYQDKLDLGQAKKFADALENQGPEKTAE